MKELEEEYIKDASECSATENEHQLDFAYFLGLWILLFASIGLAGIILGIDIFLKWRKNKKEAEESKDGEVEMQNVDEMEAIKKELEEQAQLIAEIKKLV